MGRLMGSERDLSQIEKIDSEFLAEQEQCDKDIADLWFKDIEGMRRQYIDFPPKISAGTPEPRVDIEITHQMVPVRDGSNVEIRVYRKIGFKPTCRTILLLVSHGGGWVVGNHGIEETMNRMIAGKVDSVVVSVDYRLAPEYRYPVAINDCFDTLLWCKENASTLGFNPERIVTGGCSAGGNIAAVLAQKARDEGITGVIGQVLNIPVTCHPKLFPKDKYVYKSYYGFTTTSVLNTDKMDWFWNLYLPGGEYEVYASPLLAKSLNELPPALVQVAGLDPLRDEGIAYADALKAAGVKVDLKIHTGQPHAFNIFPETQATHRYYEWILDFVMEISKV